MPTTSAARVRRHRERARAGKIMLTIEINEVQLTAILEDAGLISSEPSRAELARIVARMIEAQVTGYSREHWGDV